MKKIIHIFGASGSGTTTLARAICETYRYSHLETDNYFWIPTDPPYKTMRTHDERQNLMKIDIDKNERCVISGSLCGRGDSWGDIFIPLLDLAIFIDTPTDIRINRLEEREYRRWGERILPGGNMYEDHISFIEWAKTYDVAGLDQRSRTLHMQWIKKLPCPTVTVDGTLPIACILAQLDNMIT